MDIVNKASIMRIQKSQSLFSYDISSRSYDMNLVSQWVKMLKFFEGSLNRKYVFFEGSIKKWFIKEIYNRLTRNLKVFIEIITQRFFKSDIYVSKFPSMNLDTPSKKLSQNFIKIYTYFLFFH